MALYVYISIRHKVLLKLRHYMILTFFGNVPATNDRPEMLVMSPLSSNSTGLRLLTGVVLIRTSPPPFGK